MKSNLKTVSYFFLAVFTIKFIKNLFKGNHIVEFVSAGPKNYAYLLDTNKSDCTVKGITFNNLTCLKVNFDSIKSIVADPINRQQVIQVPQFKFTRDRDKWQLRTGVQSKQYRFVFDKRVILPNSYLTKPFGYVHH